MENIEFPTNRCTISDDWTYHNMPVIWMENDFVKIGILVGRGSDIFEFRYKPRNLNFMLRLDKDIYNPAQVVSQIRNTENQLEDYYYGGWQEVLPNSAAGLYRNAQLGQHGEIWMIPWKHAILENTGQRVSLKCWTRPLRVPILVEKTLTLTADSTNLSIDERLTNESRTDLDIMWGHHIAFGLPFLHLGGHIRTNATHLEAEYHMPEHRVYKPGAFGQWPAVEGLEGNMINASIVPPADAPPYADLAYLSGFKEKAFYEIYNHHADLGFSVHWNPDIFKYLWYWQERYATQNAPWWGKAYAIALEPWTTKHPNNPEAAIARGEYLKIKAGSFIETSLSTSIIDKKMNHD
ncbi:MAG: DUF4432 family protein [Saprospiraceae bacterium]|nr:DUF4432 family protein [Saprospiraceae bacterium]